MKLAILLMFLAVSMSGAAELQNPTTIEIKHKIEVPSDISNAGGLVSKKEVGQSFTRKIVQAAKESLSKDLFQNVSTPSSSNISSTDRNPVRPLDGLAFKRGVALRARIEQMSDKSEVSLSREAQDALRLVCASL